MAERRSLLSNKPGDGDEEDEYGHDEDDDHQKNRGPMPLADFTLYVFLLVTCLGYAQTNHLPEFAVSCLPSLAIIIILQACEVIDSF